MKSKDMEKQREGNATGRIRALYDEQTKRNNEDIKVLESNVMEKQRWGKRKIMKTIWKNQQHNGTVMWRKYNWYETQRKWKATCMKNKGPAMQWCRTVNEMKRKVKEKQRKGMIDDTNKRKKHRKWKYNMW